jgi:branched-subunit amino acid ABC-type transport system permease component
VDTLVIQLLNSLFYASILFLIACGLTLVYGVMRIVNMAHGNLYALGAYVAAWSVGWRGRVPAAACSSCCWSARAPAALAGAILEPTMLRPLYRRAEEYQLLITFGLLLILEDLLRLVWGPYPLTASALPDALGSVTILGATYPGYNIFVIVIGAVAAAGLWAFVYKTPFGIMLRATSRTCGWRRPSGQRQAVYVQAFAIGCFMARLGGRVVMPISGAVLGMGVEALILAFVVVVIGGLGSLEGALARRADRRRAPDASASRTSRRSSWPCCTSSRDRPVRPARGPVRARMSATGSPAPRPHHSPGAWPSGACRSSSAPRCAPPFETLQVSLRAHLRDRGPGLQPAARLHRPPVVRPLRLLRHRRLRRAFLVKYWRIRSMEAFVVGCVLGLPVVAAADRRRCASATRGSSSASSRLALSQVLWSLAHEALLGHRRDRRLRVPTPTLARRAGRPRRGQDDVPRDPVLLLRPRRVRVATAVMWVIVHSPFGKALQAIRDQRDPGGVRRRPGPPLPLRARSWSRAPSRAWPAPCGCP